MSTALAAVLMKERRMVSVFRAAGAVNAAQARTLDELGISRGVILRRLRERAVIRDAGSERYYLDEPSWAAVRRSRRRAIHVAWVIALIIILAVLFARQTVAPVPDAGHRGSAGGDVAGLERPGQAIYFAACGLVFSRSPSWRSPA